MGRLLRRATASVALSALVGCALVGPVAAQEPFRIWWYENPGQPNVFGMESALEQFKAAHPGVEVVFEQKTFDQMQQTGLQILGSDAAPDVLEYNKGNATLGIAALAGLLTDLTPVAEEQGWTDRVSDATMSIGKVNPETRLSGVDGNLYGVPIAGEFVWLFYNQDMLDAAGLSVPTTFDELEAAFATFVEQGVTPISLGAGDYPTVHFMYTLSLVQATPGWVADYQNLAREIDFTTDPVLSFGATKAAEWVSKGYIADNATGVNASDMVNDFVNGKMPFMISGTWQNQLVQSGVGDAFSWGAVLFPGAGVHQGAPTNIFVVPANAPDAQKQLAYDYITATLSDETQNVIGNQGGVPVAGDTTAITNEIGNLATAEFKAIAEANGFGLFPDFPAAGYYDQLLAAGQQLLGGQIGPQDYLTMIEAPYNAAVQAHQAGN